MKLLLIINLMLHAWHSSCKYFSPKTVSKFVRFDFSKKIYMHNIMKRRVYTLHKCGAGFPWYKIATWSSNLQRGANL